MVLTLVNGCGRNSTQTMLSNKTNLLLHVMSQAQLDPGVQVMSLAFSLSLNVDFVLRQAFSAWQQGSSWK